MHGREAILPTEFVFPTYPTEEISIENWIIARTNKLHKLVTETQEKVQQKIKTTQEQYSFRYNQKKKVSVTPKFQIGDQVLRYRVELGTAQTNKLELNFDGPFYIHESRLGGTYKLRRPEGRILKKLIHGNHLKPYQTRTHPEPFVEILQWLRP
jgi:hypothetical protein